MHIEPFFDQRTSTLTYLVFDEATKDAIVIDPVLDYEPSAGRIWTESVEAVGNFIDAKGLRLHVVFETHIHADHLSASQWLMKKYGARVAVSHRIAEVQEVFKDVFGWPDFPTDGRQFGMLLTHNQVVRAGSLLITALATPGHTPTCMSFKVGDAVFTGDTLALDDIGVGRCDFPRGSAEALWESVTAHLFTLPDATRLFVGHDYPSAARNWRAFTTVGVAKETNIQLRASTLKDDFVAKRKARDLTLSAPRLLYPSLQVNIVAGQMPAPEPNGRRYLRTPLTGV